MTHEESITIKALLLALLALLNIPPGAAGLMLGVIFCDSIFGVLKEWKLNNPLSFGTFTWGIIGKPSILFVPFLVAIIGLALDHNFTWIVDAFIYIIVVNDAISILGHISTIKTGQPIERGDFIALALSALSGFFAKQLKRLINVFKNEN